MLHLGCWLGKSTESGAGGIICHTCSMHCMIRPGRRFVYFPFSQLPCDADIISLFADEKLSFRGSGEVSYVTQLESGRVGIQTSFKSPCSFLDASVSQEWLY